MNLPPDASPDQSNCPPDYYRRSNGMLHQITANSTPDASLCVLNSEQLTRLASLSRDELITLLRLCNAEQIGVALMTPQEIVQAFKIRLATGGLTERDMFKALPLMREWFDREMGKAPQSIAMVVEDKGITKLSDDRLLRLEREVARMTGEDAIVIAPEPKRLTPASDSERIS